MDKAVDIIINKHKLGNLMFQSKVIKEEQNEWLKKFQNLYNYIHTTNKKLDKLDRRPPAPTTIKVRSVGTNVNMSQLNNTTKEKPYVPRKYNKLPTINTD